MGMGVFGEDSLGFSWAPRIPVSTDKSTRPQAISVGWPGFVHLRQMPRPLADLPVGLQEEGRASVFHPVHSNPHLPVGVCRLSSQRLGPSVNSCLSEG